MFCVVPSLSRHLHRKELLCTLLASFIRFQPLHAGLDNTINPMVGIVSQKIDSAFDENGKYGL